ncbi:MAG: hypothetical protein HDT28_04280 [Clostridiales bacterium]|nr:hypothetical protein [Clostridiales bacterium]
MLGKIFYQFQWRLCKYENKVLDILRNKCDAPLRFAQTKIPYNLRFIFASFEDGTICFFDLMNATCAFNVDEYIDSRFTEPNYFKTDKIDCFNIKKFGGIRKVTFKNGVLKPMLELSHIPNFEIEVAGILCNIRFGIRKRTDNFLCEMKYGSMLSNYPNKITEHCIEVRFNKCVSLDNLNLIIDRLYKLVQFINLDYAAPIGSIEVKTNNGNLLYFKEGINYGQQPIVRYNFIANYKSIIRELSKIILSNKYDMNFLSLLDKQTYVDSDYWLLAQSIENNIDLKYINLQSPVLTDEIQLYKELKSKIEHTINEFENENSKIDPEKKQFILSLIEMSKFRRKVEFLYEKFNDFAKNNHKYKVIEERDIEEFSRQVNDARNTIHALRKDRFIKERAEMGANYAIFGMCVYILDECGAEESHKFNLLQCAFV